MVNARTFDKQATAGVTGYLTRHELEPEQLRIKTLRWGRHWRFNFYHRGTLVHTALDRPGMLRWMRESTREQALAEEMKANERRRAAAVQQEVPW